jgi:hypothetical protein
MVAPDEGHRAELEAVLAAKAGEDVRAHKPRSDRRKPISSTCRNHNIEASILAKNTANSCPDGTGGIQTVNQSIIGNTACFVPSNPTMVLARAGAASSKRLERARQGERSTGIRSR